MALSSNLTCSYQDIIGNTTQGSYDNWSAYCTTSSECNTYEVICNNCGPAPVVVDSFTSNSYQNQSYSSSSIARSYLSKATAYVSNIFKDIFDSFFCGLLGDCPNPPLPDIVINLVQSGALDSVNDVCYNTTLFSCGADIYDPVYGVCKKINPTCADGASLVNGLCITAPVSGTCPNGTTYTTDGVTFACTSDPVIVPPDPNTPGSGPTSNPGTPAYPECGAGGWTYEDFQGDMMCTLNINCPPGFSSIVNGKCIIPSAPSCGTPYLYNTTQNKCLADPVCPLNSSYNTIVDGCGKTPVPFCPTPTIYTLVTGNDAICRSTPICDITSSYNYSLNKCISQDVPPACPDGMSWLNNDPSTLTNIFTN